MIAPTAVVTVARLPLGRLVVTQHEGRYPARLAHYVALLTRPEYAGHAPGLVMVAPLPGGYYAILDGHHRYCAHIMAGRGDVLCAIVEG